MVTEMRPLERIPLYLASVATGLLLAVVVGGILHTSLGSSVLVAVLPFALAALVGVAKSSTP